MAWVATLSSDGASYRLSSSEEMVGSGTNWVTPSSVDRAAPVESSAKRTNTLPCLSSSALWVSDPKIAGMAEETTTGTLNWYRRRAAISTPSHPRLEAQTRPSSSTVPEVVTPTETKVREIPVVKRLTPAMMCSMKSDSLRWATGVAMSSSRRVRPIVSNNAMWVLDV